MLSITLVHGTWGRGWFPGALPARAPNVARRSRRWFEAGSAFRTALESALAQDADGLAVTIECFEWSGDNSFVERSNAAAALAQRLDDEAEAHPGRTQVLIGHSHGGSVCMLACLHAKIARPHIATLATPFIELDASGGDSSGLAATLADQIRVISLTTYFYLIGVAIVGELVRWLSAEWLHPWWMPYLLALPFSYFGVNFWDRWSRAQLDPAWAGGGLMQRHASTHMLVLRGVDDEATMALAAAAIANRLCGPLPFLAAVCFYAALFALVLTYNFGIGAAQFDRDLLQSAVLRWLPIVWMLDLLTGLLMASSGRELLACFRGLQIRSHSSPDHGHHLSVLTLPSRGHRGLLRHGLYDHGLAPVFIHLWMKNGFELSPGELDVAVGQHGQVEVRLLKGMADPSAEGRASQE